MPDVTLAEAARILLPLVVVGVFAAKQEFRTRRWDPAFFRNGICVVRMARNLGETVNTLPMPTASGGLFGWKVEARRLGEREVAFFAPVMNGSLLRGLLRVDATRNALEVVGHLQWALWLLLLGGLTFLGDWRFAIPAVALALVAYVGEVHRFRGILDDVARRCINQSGV